MEKVVQDIFGRPMTFGPLIVVTALIIIATGLLIYKLTEKRNGQPEMPTYIFIEGLGWVYKLVEKINRPRAEITYRFIEGFGWVYENKEKEINVRELCREFQREGFCEGLPDQPEDDEIGCDEAAAAEDQG